MKTPGCSNAEPRDRIAYLEQLVARLAARVTSLEQRAMPEPLVRHNAQQRAEGERRRATIKQLLDSQPGPVRGAAKRIHTRLLETGIRLSVRGLQHHIREIRKADGVASLAQSRVVASATMRS
jgi:hypothetical protein